MSSFPTRNRKFQKIAKQFKKLKTTTLATFQANISWERPRKKKKKIILMSSYQTRNRKFQKNSKNFKNLKNTIMASHQSKISWERPRKRENKK